MFKKVCSKNMSFKFLALGYRGDIANETFIWQTDLVAGGRSGQVLSFYLIAPV